MTLSDKIVYDKAHHKPYNWFFIKEDVKEFIEKIIKHFDEKERYIKYGKKRNLPFIMLKFNREFKEFIKEEAGDLE